MKNDFSYITLQEFDFKAEKSKEYIFNIIVVGGLIKVKINSKEVINYFDEDYLTHGCVGYSILDNGRLLVKDISFKEL